MPRPERLSIEEELRKALLVALDKRSLREIGEAAQVPHTTIADFVNENPGKAIKFDQAERLGRVLGLWLSWERIS